MEETEGQQDAGPRETIGRNDALGSDSFLTPVAESPQHGGAGPEQKQRSRFGNHLLP